MAWLDLSPDPPRASARAHLFVEIERGFLPRVSHSPKCALPVFSNAADTSPTVGPTAAAFWATHVGMASLAMHDYQLL